LPRRAVSAPLLARAQTGGPAINAIGAADARNPDPDRADSVVIMTRNIPRPRPSTNAAVSATQNLVYSNPGGALTYGGGAMAGSRSQTSLGGVSNVNINKNKIWFANAAGRVYPAARARTTLSGPLDFGGTRDNNIRGNVRTAGGEARRRRKEKKRGAAGRRRRQRSGHKTNARQGTPLRPITSGSTGQLQRQDSRIR